MKKTKREIKHQAALEYLQEIILLKSVLAETEDDFLKRTIRQKIQWREDKVREIMEGKS